MSVDIISNPNRLGQLPRVPLPPRQLLIQGVDFGGMYEYETAEDVKLPFDGVEIKESIVPSPQEEFAVQLQLPVAELFFESDAWPEHIIAAVAAFGVNRALENIVKIEQEISTEQDRYRTNNGSIIRRARSMGSYILGDRLPIRDPEYSMHLERISLHESRRRLQCNKLMQFKALERHTDQKSVMSETANLAVAGSVEEILPLDDSELDSMREELLKAGKVLREDDEVVSRLTSERLRILQQLKKESVFALEDIERARQDRRQLPTLQRILQSLRPGVAYEVVRYSRLKKLIVDYEPLKFELPEGSGLTRTDTLESQTA